MIKALTKRFDLQDLFGPNLEEMEKTGAFQHLRPVPASPLQWFRAFEYFSKDGRGHYIPGFKDFTILHLAMDFTERKHVLRRSWLDDRHRSSRSDSAVAAEGEHGVDKWKSVHDLIFCACLKHFQPEFVPANRTIEYNRLGNSKLLDRNVKLPVSKGMNDFDKRWGVWESRASKTAKEAKKHCPDDKRPRPKCDDSHGASRSLNASPNRGKYDYLHLVRALVAAPGVAVDAKAHFWRDYEGDLIKGPVTPLGIIARILPETEATRQQLHDDVEMWLFANDLLSNAALLAEALLQAGADPFAEATVAETEKTPKCFEYKKDIFPRGKVRLLEKPMRRAILAAIEEKHPFRDPDVSAGRFLAKLARDRPELGMSRGLWSSVHQYVVNEEFRDVFLRTKEHRSPIQAALTNTGPVGAFALFDTLNDPQGIFIHERHLATHQAVAPSRARQYQAVVVPTDSVEELKKLFKNESATDCALTVGTRRMWSPWGKCMDVACLEHRNMPPEECRKRCMFMGYSTSIATRDGRGQLFANLNDVVTDGARKSHYSFLQKCRPAFMKEWTGYMIASLEKIRSAFMEADREYTSRTCGIAFPGRDTRTIKECASRKDADADADDKCADYVIDFLGDPKKSSSALKISVAKSQMDPDIGKLGWTSRITEQIQTFAQDKFFSWYEHRDDPLWTSAGQAKNIMQSTVNTRLPPTLTDWGNIDMQSDLGVSAIAFRGFGQKLLRPAASRSTSTTQLPDGVEIPPTAEYMIDLAHYTKYQTRTQFDKFGATAYFDKHYRIVGIWHAQYKKLVLPFDGDCKWRLASLIMEKDWAGALVGDEGGNTKLYLGEFELPAKAIETIETHCDIEQNLLVYTDNNQRTKLGSIAPDPAIMDTPPAPFPSPSNRRLPAFFDAAGWKGPNLSRMRGVLDHFTSWEHAKWTWKSTLINHNFQYRHLVHVHLIVAGSLAHARLEHLSPANPIRRLTRPYLYGTLGINSAVLTTLTGENYAAHRQGGLDYVEGFVEVMKDHFEDFR